MDTSSVLQELNSYVNLSNFVGGKWTETKKYAEVINPLNGRLMHWRPDTQPDEFGPFLEGLKSCPKSGLHNPLKNPERYDMLGKVSFNVACALEDENIANHFAQLVQSVMPKSRSQCMGEVDAVKRFCMNYSGDRVRLSLATGHTTPGNHFGQQIQDYPWPFGSVAIISPFNFPFEIIFLQLLAALYMGNRPLIKPDKRCGVVAEQSLRLLHICGLPKTDIDLIHCSGPVMEELLRQGKDVIRLVQFTGSSRVAEKLSVLMAGKLKMEDAGFNPRVLGPDYRAKDLKYVLWRCDQCLFAAAKQKCSATSIIFAHYNWGLDFFEKLGALATKRNLNDLTNGPVLTRTTDEMLLHIKKLSTIPGAKIIFGGKPLIDHQIPACYGSIEPTLVLIPIEKIACDENFGTVTTEVFGPVAIGTFFDDSQNNLVLDLCERMTNHLTAGINSRDPEFNYKMLGETVNGTTYCGPCAPTTGAMPHQWFGPSGDPRGAGIGTPPAIILTWSFPRCIAFDFGSTDHAENLVQS